jgi:hypothetical protein
MEEFLANAPLQALLGLMVVPIGAAIILVGFLFFFYTRRSKKSKMKHGTQPETSVSEESISSDIPGVNTNILSDTLSSLMSSNDQLASPAESSLDLGLLSKRVDAEVTMTDRPKSSDREAVDLARKPENVSSDTSQPVQSSEPVELLRLLRDPRSGQLIVEIAGQRYTKLAHITEKKIGQYILELTAHLLAFTNGVIVTDAGMKSVYTPKVGKAPMPVIAPPPISQSPVTTASTLSSTPEKRQPDMPVPPPPAEVEAAFLASLRSSASQPEPQQSKKRGFFGRTPTQSAPSSPALNLAEEINEIVQARLRSSPLATTTRLDITSEPGGGIRIEVNGQFYASPDDIPDPAIKDLIKASIKEWERS